MSNFTNLLDTVRAARIANPAAALAQSQEVAEQVAVDSILKECNFEEEALNAERMGRKMCRLLTWEGRGPQYRGVFLSDMLDLGSLVSRFQEHFDSTYGENKFKVFNHQISPGTRRFVALAVSWDADGFAKADEILTNNRESAQDRARQRSDNRSQWVPRDHQERQYTPRDYHQQREQREYQPREQREQRAYQPREQREQRPQREYQPREQRDQREYQPRHGKPQSSYDNY